MNIRSGKYRINLTGEAQYKSFIPKALFPFPPITFDDNMIHLLTIAHRSIGILMGISQQIPHIDLFVSMYIRKEALLSSQIEGTQATLDDILDPNIKENTNMDVLDVINYIKASHFATNRSKELPICNRLIKETHAVLMANAKGTEKNPGEYRQSQNWIGPSGSSLQNAKFIPPNIEDMNKAMNDLEICMNSEHDLDQLIVVALIHYQFETIHPFLDGNGRMGRLLISLYLKNIGILQYQTLYISYFLKRNKIEYYDRLSEVREKGNYEQWIKFFLLALYETAQDAAFAIEKLSILHNNHLKVLESAKNTSKTVIKVFHYIERFPIISIPKISKDLHISFNSASQSINILVKVGILKQTTPQKRNRIFVYESYLEILRKDT